jgi:hypothetical protein
MDLLRYEAQACKHSGATKKGSPKVSLFREHEDCYLQEPGRYF